MLRTVKQIVKKYKRADKDDHPTPQDLFDRLDKEFNFTVDVCSTHINAKCNKHYTKEDNGLAQDWGGETVWLAAPFSDVTPWLKKAVTETRTDNTKVVCLLKFDPSTKWFKDAMNHCSEIYSMKRIKFIGHKCVAGFPTCLMVFNSNRFDDIRRPLSRYYITKVGKTWKYAIIEPMR